MKILIIDDDLALLQMLEESLVGIGYDVSIATNGVEGVAKFDADSINLVIVDMMLPNGGGLWTANHIHHKNPQIPIIAISGESSCLDGIEKFGANKSILKPFHFGELEKAISDLL